MAQWTLNYTTYDNSQWTSVVGNISSGGTPLLFNLPWTQENLPNFKDVELDIATAENLILWRIDNSGTYLYLCNVWPNIQTANIHNTRNVVNMTKMFYSCDNLNNIANMDTSNVTDMSSMFVSCRNLINMPNFNTSKVTSMNNMFRDCSNLTNIPNLNTINVTTMNNMFSGCYSLTTIPNFNTSNVTSMYSMFSSCENLTEIPHFNTSNVVNMSIMFSGCHSLTTIPNLDTSNVTNMAWMFSTLGNLITIPNLNTINVINMRNMFTSCYNLINIPLFNTSNVIDMRNMFNRCHNLSNLSLKNIARSLPNVSQLTSQNSNLQNIGLSQNQINYISTTRYASQLQARGWNIADNYVKPALVKSVKMKQSDGTINLAMLGTNAEYVDMEDGTTLEETVQNLKQYIDDNVANILGGTY